MAVGLEGLVTRLRFRHLRLLVELERSGTLSKAATLLHLSQPALSKMLKEVEDTFGFALFQRGARGLTMTPRGQVVVQGASILLAELGHVSAAAEASGEQPVAILHLGAPPAVAAGGMLPAVIQRLQAGPQHIVVALREEPVPRLFEALVRGELDALLTSYNQASFAAKRPTRLVYERCAEHEYVVIAPPGHRLAGKRGISWQAVAGERWIMPEPSLLSRQALESQFLRAGAPVPAPWVVSNSPATNVQLVAAGVGIAAVPAAMAHAEECIGRVVRLRVALTPPRVPTALVYRASGESDPVLQRLRAAVGELLVPP
ncbi:MAG TPA: LysR family transcriptional regulator [Ideonella sp.]|nr:LysR family transcriptional regulator [Ideonella sp.]